MNIIDIKNKQKPNQHNFLKEKIDKIEKSIATEPSVSKICRYKFFFIAQF